MEELIRQLAADAYVDEASVSRVLYSLGVVLPILLAHRETKRVAIPDVGSFRVSRHAPRQFKNPVNGLVYRTPMKNTVHFRPDPRLLRYLDCCLRGEYQGADG